MPQRPRVPFFFNCECTARCEGRLCAGLATEMLFIHTYRKVSDRRSIFDFQKTMDFNPHSPKEGVTGKRAQCIHLDKGYKKTCPVYGTGLHLRYHPIWRNSPSRHLNAMNVKRYCQFPVCPHGPIRTVRPCRFSAAPALFQGAASMLLLPLTGFKYKVYYMRSQ